MTDKMKKAYVTLNTGHTYCYIDHKRSSTSAETENDRERDSTSTTTTTATAAATSNSSTRPVPTQPGHNEPRGTLLCLHGFPDQSYGWTSQIVSWANAGYRVIMPDMLGYGNSDKPQDETAYSTKRLCQDLAALLDHLQLQKVILVSHDWGAAVAWRFALWYPERLLALINFSVPYFPPSKKYIPPSVASQIEPAFAYQEYFADPVSTAEIEASLDVFLPALFQAPKQKGQGIHILRPGQMRSLVTGDKSKFKMPNLVIDQEELERYKKDFAKGGMYGPLCYYRNTFSRFEHEKDAQLDPVLPASLPVLFIYGSHDSTCPQKFVDRMPAFVPNLKTVRLQDKGHWILLEAKEETTNEVLEFLDKLFPSADLKSGVQAKL